MFNQYSIMYDCIDCPICGCKDFSITWAGPHIKAICKSCGEVYKNRQNMVQFVQQTPDIDENYERATPKQLSYIKALMNSYGGALPKDSAGDLIALLKKVGEEV